MPALVDLLPVRDAGVTASELEAAERSLGHRLPNDIREFLLVSNGSEWADFPAIGSQILSLQDTVGLAQLPERAGPQRLIDVASDGSRERFCVDPASGEIVWLDIVGAEPPVVCASTLTDLVTKLARGWNPFDLLA
jgi:cell wall assembly regulator SMI1